MTGTGERGLIGNGTNNTGISSGAMLDQMETVKAVAERAVAARVMSEATQAVSWVPDQVRCSAGFHFFFAVDRKLGVMCSDWDWQQMAEDL